MTKSEIKSQIKDGLRRCALTFSSGNYGRFELSTAAFLSALNDWSEEGEFLDELSDIDWRVFYLFIAESL